jgi:hypothetical protein
MSKMRGIKPEFWSSEQVVNCSPLARLLFIGMWNFCDDAGIHPASIKRLKMEVFPADDFTIDQINQWVNELINNKLLQQYNADDGDYWIVTGWHHQRINRPYYKHPKPSDEQSKPKKHCSSTAQALLEQCSSSVQTTPKGKEDEDEDENEMKGKEVVGGAKNPLPKTTAPAKNQNEISANDLIAEPDTAKIIQELVLDKTKCLAKAHKYLIWRKKEGHADPSMQHHQFQTWLCKDANQLKPDIPKSYDKQTYQPSPPKRTVAENEIIASLARRRELHGEGTLNFLEKKQLSDWEAIHGKAEWERINGINYLKGHENNEHS